MRRKLFTHNPKEDRPNTYNTVSGVNSSHITRKNIVRTHTIRYQA